MCTSSRWIHSHYLVLFITKITGTTTGAQELEIGKLCSWVPVANACLLPYRWAAWLNDPTTLVNDDVIANHIQQPPPTPVLAIFDLL
jgi:hypothetical protein